MANLYLIFSSQEYATANHKNLWHAMAEEHQGDLFIVINIAADYIVTQLKRKTYRIKEAKNPPVKISENLFVFRPIFILRPEISPSCFSGFIFRQLLKQLSHFWNLDSFQKWFSLAYDPTWVQIVSRKPRRFIQGYYLFDEVRLNADTCKINKKRARKDDFACKCADIIFAISKGVIQNRPQYKEKMLLVGNGSVFNGRLNEPKNTKGKFAFIGNFRSWIDTTLLTQTIKRLQDYEFHIIGNIESDMAEYLDFLKQNFPNVVYDGKKPKEEIAEEYRKYSCIIIPYIQNKFIYCTRPIKIVEALFEQTPVVTVPVSGYDESDFIRFARTPEEFEEQIRSINERRPRFDSDQYAQFVNKSSWDYIGKTIVSSLERLDGNERYKRH